MFAVPAFSSLSSANLKSSFEKPSNNGDDVLAPFDENSTVSRTKSRKRKRSQIGERNAVTEISPENIGELWSKIFEGGQNVLDKAASKRTKNNGNNEDKKRKDRKKRKQEEKLQVANMLEKPSGDPLDPITDTDGGILNIKNDVKLDDRKDAEDENREKKKHKKDKKKKEKSHKQAQEEDPFAIALEAAAIENVAANAPKTPTLTPLQEKMRQKLSGARFRHLNQLLYTTPSAESSTLFKSQPEMFTDYHAGFRQQVESWPENPVDIYIQRLFARGKLRASGFRAKHKANGISSVNSNPLGTNGLQDTAEPSPLPRAKDGFTTIIDLGCGEAALAKAIAGAKPRPKFRIHSYDLHAPNQLVTVADIANLPLQAASVDVAVFCLALMGTNWLKMIEEAVRVLRNGGEVWIAEIKSRFARTKPTSKENDAEKGEKKGKGKKNTSKNLKEDTNPTAAFVEERDDDNDDQNRWALGEQQFIEALSRRGLRLKSRNGKNKMFVLLDFEKVGGKGSHSFQIPPKPDMYGRISKKFHENGQPDIDEASILQPCLYKIR